MGKCDQRYVEAWIQKRFAGEVPDSACRIEAQLSRVYLKQFGIDTPADLKKNATTLFSRFLLDQFRLVDQRIKKGKRNHGRAKVLTIWTDLAAASEQVFDQMDHPLVRVDRTRVDPQWLIKQGIGCLRNALLQKGEKIESVHDFQAAAFREIDVQLGTESSQLDFVEDYRCRESEFRG